MDMQQHPEKYSDEQIEAVMAELDKPVDVETAWKDFSSKNITENALRTTARQPAKRISLRWWQAIAAVVIIAQGVWGVTTLHSDKLKFNFQSWDKPETQDAITEEKPAAKDAAPKKDERKNATHKEADNEPLIIVNGQIMQKADALSMFSPNDIESVRVWKDKAGKTAYEARFGEQAKHGVIDVTLKAGREMAYADILNSNPDELEPSSPMMRVRGTGYVASDSGPLVIVNGQKIQSVVLSMFNPDDIESIRVWKDEANRATFETRFGEQAKHGVIDVTLKAGREVAYADFLNPNADGEDVFSNVDKMPEFPGGPAALEAYLKENLGCPAVVRDSAVTGRIIVSFVIGREGSLQDVKFIRSLLRNADKTFCTDSTLINLCAEEARRVCRQMPRWVPGGVRTDDGYRSIAVRYFLPLTFGEQSADERKGMRIR